MAIYPNKAQILEKEIVYKEETIKKIKTWKELHWQNWKQKTIDQKNTALCELIHSLAKPRKPVEINPHGTYYCYNPGSTVIQLDKERPSVISALHELAHHFYGASELQACRWSVWLFKKVFTQDFEKLEFEGHLLKKKV